MGKGVSHALSGGVKINMVVVGGGMSELLHWFLPFTSVLWAYTKNPDRVYNSDSKALYFAGL